MQVTAGWPPQHYGTSGTEHWDAAAMWLAGNVQAGRHAGLCMCPQGQSWRRSRVLRAGGPAAGKGWGARTMYTTGQPASHQGKPGSGTTHTVCCCMAGNQLMHAGSGTAGLQVGTKHSSTPAAQQAQLQLQRLAALTSRRVRWGSRQVRWESRQGWLGCSMTSSTQVASEHRECACRERSMPVSTGSVHAGSGAAAQLLKCSV